MKPLKLTMSAFGSYANEQAIVFSKLGSAGLYLITGETGAGKTTIFDAVSFALFGKASGAARGDYLMLRSDFADEKAKTFVELDFLCGEERYNIKRTIKKTGQEVALILPDGTCLNGDRSVKAKITEIIGLDRDQFAQIVMIAQNDFLRFLQSSTDERLKILRSIFGTEALRLFQDRLKLLAKQESDNRAMLVHDFERYEVNVYEREEIFAGWEAQLKADKLELNETERCLSEHDKQKRELAAALAVAEELNKKFTGLSQYRRELDVHNAKSNDIAEMKRRAFRGEASLQKVKPLSAEAQKAKSDHAAAQADSVSAQKKKDTAEIELEEAVKSFEALPPLEEAQEAYSVLLKKWETATQDLKQLVALKANHKEIIRKLAVLTEKKEEFNDIQELLKRLPPINDCQAELDMATEELKRNEDRLETLLELQKDFNAVKSKQAELAKEQSEFETLNAHFKSVDEKHRALEEAFLCNQAGIIAKHLADGSPCPVCGSVTHPAPASLPDSDIDEARLKSAGKLKETAQMQREEKASLCRALQAEAEMLAKRFLSGTAAHAAEITIENADILLRDNINNTQSAVQSIGGKKRDIEKSLTALKDSAEKYTSRQSELTTLTSSLQSETDTLTKRFMKDFSAYSPDTKWEVTGAELDDLLSRIKTEADELTAKKEKDKSSLDLLASNRTAAAQRKANAESAVKSAATLLVERIANEQKLLNYRNESHSKYEEALFQNGFIDESDYEAALVTENELAALRNQISDYEKKGEQLERDIIRLDSETAGKEPPDIARLQAESDAINAKAKALNDKRDEINGRLQKTGGALEELRRVAVNFEKSEKAYAAMKQLSDTANGKLDFETYAQMAYFERVLRAANLRLKEMSQSRYALLRKTGGGDGRKRSGLEMEVMDSYTGKARSANSLSGGESFMASLSLALGLSDVVRQNAGGIRLDAMFIDEGFGSLDTEVLELSIRTLSAMAGANRIIGIISHVAELRERIDKQVRVEKTSVGSKISLVI